MADTMQTEQGDIKAMLEKIKQLEAEKEQLTGERSQLSSQLQQASSKYSALSQKTQEEMMNKINTTIATWLASLPADTISPEKKEQVKEGLHELAKATAQDSGLYQVMCCALEQHISNVTQLKEIRQQRDELKKRLEGGEFSREDERVSGKRKAEVIAEDDSKPASGGMWNDFKIMLQKDKGWCVGAALGR